MWSDGIEEAYVKRQGFLGFDGISNDFIRLTKNYIRFRK